jgi:MFS family permease
MSGRYGFRDVLAVAEFRALWSAEVISVCGDQLARVALSVLVYERTSSVALTALTYALTFVSALLGGAVLSGLADRFPRRTVLITADLVRAVLAGSLALPGLPLAALWGMVFTVALAGAPFKAAQLALLPDVLEGERYPVGLALRTVSTQLAQLAGFGVGGTVLLAISSETALGINAATFALSALIVMWGVRPRLASHRASTEPTSGHKTSAMRLLSSNPRLLVLVGFIVLAGLTVAPEGVAAPYAAGLGGSTVAVGVLLAADPLGSALGAWFFSRWRSTTVRTTAIVPMAIASGLALVPCFVRPGLVMSAVLWALSGALTTMFLIQAQALLTRSVPDTRRGAVIGLASAGLQTSQGLVVLATGLAGEYIGVYRAVGAIGMVTAALAAAVGIAWRRARLRGQSDFEDEHGASHSSSAAQVRGHGSAFGIPPLPGRPAANEVRLA